MTAAGEAPAASKREGASRSLSERCAAVTVDTTGAGDCFHAALIAARLEGAELPRRWSLPRGGGDQGRARGARGGLPTRDEVEHCGWRSHDIPGPARTRAPHDPHVAFGIIIDDIVFPDGATHMGVLGGGGPQTAWGMAAARGQR